MNAETENDQQTISLLHAENIKLWNWFQEAVQSGGRLQRKLNAAENEVENNRQVIAEQAAEIERLRLQVKMIPCPEYRDDPRLYEIIENQRAEIKRLREMLQVCRDKWIPFREVEFRKRVHDALGE